MGCQHLFQLKNSCYLFNSNKKISFQYFHQSFILISCIDTSKLPLNWKLSFFKLPQKTLCSRLSFNCSRLLTVYHFNNNVKSKTSPFSNINNMYLINKINLIFLKVKKTSFPTILQQKYTFLLKRVSNCTTWLFILLCNMHLLLHLLHCRNIKLRNI